MNERVTGEDMYHIIVIIPTKGNASIEAVDQAIESVPGGVALIDVVVSNKYFYIPIFTENPAMLSRVQF